MKTTTEETKKEDVEPTYEAKRQGDQLRGAVAYRRAEPHSVIIN